MLDSILIRRHNPGLDPATLTVFQFMQYLANVDRSLYGPVVHAAPIPE